MGAVLLNYECQALCGVDRAVYTYAENGLGYCVLAVTYGNCYSTLVSFLW